MEMAISSCDFEDTKDKQKTAKIAINKIKGESGFLEKGVMPVCTVKVYLSILGERMKFAKYLLGQPRYDINSQCLYQLYIYI